MIERLREFFRSSGGQVTAIVLGLLGLVVLVWAVKGNFGESDAAALSSDRVFICSETRKPFNHTLKEGETIPVYSPHSGKNTGYQAELCYWTKDGKPKEKPTPVLLEESLGKPGPTFCPDCGRLVIGHNPAAQPGGRPPPTKEEYAARHPPKPQRS